MDFLTLITQEQKQVYLGQVWSLLIKSYENVPGGLHFPNQDALLEEANEWHIVVKDKTVIALTLFKYKCGLKLVALAKSKMPEARLALIKLLGSALTYSWMELSDQAELFVMRECNGHLYLIHASVAEKLLHKTIFPAELDGYHYRRKIMNMMKTKVLLGTPNIQKAA